MSVYRLGAGAIAKATLEGSTSYIIEQWALQSDQTLGQVWLVADATTYPRRARVEPTANLNLKSDGRYTTDIVLGYCTRGMLDYIDTTFSLSDAVPSTAATWLAIDQDGDWRCFQGILYRPREGDTFTKAPRGALNVILRCVYGIEVT